MYYCSLDVVEVRAGMSTNPVCSTARVLDGHRRQDRRNNKQCSNFSYFPAKSSELGLSSGGEIYHSAGIYAGYQVE